MFDVRYDNWLQGKDFGYHPEDDTKTCKMTLAPPPSAEEFLINKTNEEVIRLEYLVVQNNELKISSVDNRVKLN